MGAATLTEFLKKTKRAYTAEQLAERFAMSKGHVQRIARQLYMEGWVRVEAKDRKLTYRANPYAEREDAPIRHQSGSMGLAIQDARGAAEGGRLVQEAATTAKPTT